MTKPMSLKLSCFCSLILGLERWIRYLMWDRMIPQPKLLNEERRGWHKCWLDSFSKTMAQQVWHLPYTQSNWEYHQTRILYDPWALPGMVPEHRAWSNARAPPSVVHNPRKKKEKKKNFREYYKLLQSLYFLNEFLYLKQHDLQSSS